MSLVVGVTISFLLIVIPTYYAIILYKNRNHLPDPETVDHYIVLYEHLKTNSMAAIFTYQIFMLRRLLMVAVLWLPAS